MSTGLIKVELLRALQSRPDCRLSFAELLRDDYPQWAGSITLSWGNHKNLIVAAVCKEFEEAIHELSSEGQIEFSVIESPIQRAAYGALSSSLPMALKIKDYRTPRWLPVLIKLI